MLNVEFLNVTQDIGGMKIQKFKHWLTFEPFSSSCLLPSSSKVNILNINLGLHIYQIQSSVYMLDP